MAISAVRGLPTRSQRSDFRDAGSVDHSPPAADRRRSASDARPFTVGDLVWLYLGSAWRPGVIWNIPGATGILTLRCHRASNHFDQIWPQSHNQIHPATSANLQLVSAPSAA